MRRNILNERVYQAKCFKCQRFYEDVNFRDAYKDSVLKVFSSDKNAGRVIRCCPFCDDILITAVSIPKFEPDVHT